MYQLLEKSVGVWIIDTSTPQRILPYKIYTLLSGFARFQVKAERTLEILTKAIFPLLYVM